jgi:hypothetical protein
MTQAAAEVRAGRFCVTLEQARELAVWHWLVDVLREVSPDPTPAGALAYLPPVYRARQNDRQHRAAMLPLGDALLTSAQQPLDAMAAFMRILRAVPDYGSRYFQALERRPAGRSGFAMHVVAVGVSAQWLTVADPTQRVWMCARSCTRPRSEADLAWCRRHTGHPETVSADACAAVGVHSGGAGDGPGRPRR